MNKLIYLLSGFLLIAVLVYFFVKNEYVKQKALGWIYIILFFILLLINQYTLIAGLIILSSLVIFEFFRNLFKKGFSNLQRVIFGVLFLALLVGFNYFIYKFTNYFILIFIVISFSDIIAYFVGKNIPWKKGFTKLSPNKSLSGVLAQVVFIFLVLIVCFYFQNGKSGYIQQCFNIAGKCVNWQTILRISYLLGSVFIAILAPIGDLTESYFKRKTQEKDMAYYIPGHGGVLDRIDSSFLSVGIIGLVIMIFQCCF